MDERTRPLGPHTRVRSGAHRGTRSIAAAVLPSLLAVAAVSALITSLAVWQAQEPRRGPTAIAAPASSAETTEAQVVTSPPAESAPTSSTSPPPAATSPATPTVPSRSAQIRTTPHPPTAPEVSVVVLNQSSRTGLASSTGAELAERGWNVAAVGNFRGVVPATTVYYPPGAQDQALELARNLRAEPRIRPRFGNLSTTRLTVVVTASYPG